MGSNSENCIQENKQTHQNQITRVFGKELTNNHIPINNPSDYLSKKVLLTKKVFKILFNVFEPSHSEFHRGN